MGGSTRSRSATLCPGLMSTCAEVLAATLRDAGVERMFGLPGGEILDFIEAARKVGIEFVLTRHEAVAAFLADAAGQIARQPAVCVSTLGPGALNLTLGVANAFLDRSPLLAITATMSTAARPFATPMSRRRWQRRRGCARSTAAMTSTNRAGVLIAKAMRSGAGQALSKQLPRRQHTGAAK